MTPSRMIAVSILVLLSAACAPGGAYEGLRQGARNECNKLSEPDRSACLERNQDDYATYKKKREGNY